MSDSNILQAEGGVSVPSTPSKPKDGARNIELPESPLPKPSDDQKKKVVKLSDFEIGHVLGQGTFAKVFVGTLKVNNKKFAIKMLDKQFITRHNKTDTVMNEKKVLQLLDSPAVIKLAFTFQDPYSLYYVLELCESELCDEIIRLKKLPLETVKFYTAEIIKALEYLHGMKVIHRDLKPENILIAESGHLKLCDFGTSKILGEVRSNSVSGSNGRERKKSFVGTAEYVSPEVLDGKPDQPVTHSVDLWALGCIIFQMVTGNPPFRGQSEYFTFQKILKREFEYPSDFPEVVKDLVDKLLVLDPTKRLGYKSYSELKDHEFFAGIEWDHLFEAPARVPCPPKPVVEVKESKKEKPISGGSDDGSDDESASASPVPETKSSAPVTKSTPEKQASVSAPSSPASAASAWSKFLIDNELIVFTGPVKRGRFMAKKRQLIVTDFPRLLFIDPEKMQQDGEIPFAAEMHVMWKSDKGFVVNSGAEKIHLEALTSDSRQWIETITRAIKLKKEKTK